MINWSQESEIVMTERFGKDTVIALATIENEVPDVLSVPFEKAVDIVMNSEICCSSSAHGILRAAKEMGL